MFTPGNGPTGEELMAGRYNVDDTAEPSDHLAPFANPADLPESLWGGPSKIQKLKEGVLSIS